jgi:hypothetical protein
MSILLAILLQSVFNVANAYFDAYRIMKHKTIAHGINLGAYFIFVCAELFFIHLSDNYWTMSGQIILFLFQAFFNRQNTFDIPLNWRRGLKFDYMSLDKPPKAWWDRQEYKLFGSNGRAIACTYMILWAIFISLTIIFLK